MQATVEYKGWERERLLSGGTVQGKALRGGLVVEGTDEVGLGQGVEGFLSARNVSVKVVGGTS